MNDFLKKLDEKFEEKEQQNRENLKAILDQLRTFEINIMGKKFVASLMPSSLEKEMVEDVKKAQNDEMDMIEFCKKYFPIWYGIDNVENIPMVVLKALLEGYIKKYAELMQKRDLFHTNG